MKSGTVQAIAKRPGRTRSVPHYECCALVGVIDQVIREETEGIRVLPRTLHSSTYVRRLR